MKAPDGLARYVALGDSMSIDLYPGLDHMAATGATRPLPGLGAASLLHRNEARLFPGFSGADLLTAFPQIESLNLCVDGATVGDTTSGQLPFVPEGDAPALVTVTAGGNDLLGLLGAPEARGAAVVAATVGALAELLAGVRRRAPNVVVVVATVYDPTDGTGRLDRLQLTALELGWLAAYNDGVRGLCDGAGVRLADVHRHFLGHGITAPPADRWYWPPSIIEPGLRGASEIRRLWLEALGLRVSRV